MAKKYAVKAAFLQKNPEAVTLVDRDGEKVAVALCGKELKVQRGGSKSSPPIERIVPGATQSDLKYLFENERPPYLSEVEDSAPANMAKQ